MKKGLLLSMITLVTISLHAQVVEWPTDIAEVNTGANSTYLVQSSNLDGTPLVFGYVLGAFYKDDAGNLKCGGFANCSSSPHGLSVWGDDVLTPTKDGFSSGDTITWLAYNNFLDQTYSASIEATNTTANIYTLNTVNVVTAFNVSGSISGCNDTIACNFNTNATEDDGSCEYAAENLNCDGTCIDTDGDAVCDLDEITGCQDASACNYNTMATDSALCVFATGDCDSCSGDTDGSGTVVDNDADNDGVCNADELGACTDETACNYNNDSTVETDDLLCVYVTEGCETCSGELDGTGSVIDNDLDNDGVCNADEISGCQDATACNYDATATDSDESCEGLFGCTDSTYYEYNQEATCDNNSCSTLIVFGCTDSTASNYNANATEDDNSCIAVISGCIDSSAFNYNSQANTSDETCVNEIDVEFTYSTTNSTLTFSVVVDTLNLILGSNEITTGDIIGGFYLADGVLNCAGYEEWTGEDISINLYEDDLTTPEVDGITSDATIYWIVLQDATQFNYLVDLSITSVPGANFVNQMDVNQTIVIGCQDSTAFNYNSAATIADGACVPFIEGCTEMDACNYNEDANTNDGTCYTITATIDSFMINTPLSVVTDAVNPTYTWFLNDVEQTETTNEYSPFTNGVYSVTVEDELGCKVTATYTLENLSIDELDNKINLYPNPASEYVEINSSTEMIESISVITITGKLMQEHQVDAMQYRINNTELAKGMYFIKIKMTNQEITKQVLFE